MPLRRPTRGLRGLPSGSRTLVSILTLTLLALIASGGCAGTSAVEPGQDEPTDLTLHDWKAIYASRVVGNAVERERIGFVELRYEDAQGPATGVQYFYRPDDLDHAIGFRLPSGESYRFRPVKNDVPGEESLGRQTLERMTSLLFSTDRDLEFRTVEDR